jgi:YHS domain-containing protein
MGRFLLWLVLGMIAFFRMKSAFSPPKVPPPKKPGKPTPPDKPDYTEADEMVEDPVCGTFVDADTALYLVHEDTRYHFCSERCRNKFLQRSR